jgi:hypothetical protein
MSANTFATFLGTIKTLESARPSSGHGWPESEVLTIAKTLLSSNGEAPLKAVMGQVNLPQEVFLGAFVAGRDKGLFDGQ